MKNVAGFDLVRLSTGAWGTLGPIAEVSVRLRARPVADTTLAVSLGSEDAATLRAVAAIRGLPFTFEALELLDGRAAKQLGLDDGVGATVLARAAGTAQLVRAMGDALAGVGRTREVDVATWSRLRAMEPASGAVLRVAHAPAHADRTWAAARAIAGAFEGWAHLAIGRTVARVSLPHREGEPTATFAARIATALSHARRSFDGSIVGERLPGPAWSSTALSQPAGGDAMRRLLRGVRTAFDPDCRMNPGILGAAGGER